MSAIQGLVYKGKSMRRSGLNVVAIQRSPCKRTLCANGRRYFITFPRMIYVIEYWETGLFWKNFSYEHLRVYVTDSDIKTQFDSVASCPLPMHGSDGSLCMGNSMDRKGHHKTLKGLTDAVIQAYLASEWTTDYLSRPFSISGYYKEEYSWERHEEQLRDIREWGSTPGQVSSLKQLAFASKKHPDLYDLVQLTPPHIAVTLYQAIFSDGNGKFCPFKETAVHTS